MVGCALLVCSTVCAQSAPGMDELGFGELQVRAPMQALHLPVTITHQMPPASLVA